MTTKNIRTNKGENLNITKLGSFSWYNTNAYGLTKKVVWQDEKGGMWVRMNGEFRNVNFRRWGTYAQYTDNRAVEPAYFNRMYATEVK